MPRTYRAAAIQMNSGEDSAANLATAAKLVEEAAREGAQLVVLPEMFACLGRWEVMVASAESIPGPTSRLLADLARRLKITLVGGSFCETSDSQGKVFNTSLLLGPEGNELARYRKIHLFDVELSDQMSFKESRWLAPGDRVASTTTECGQLGQAICYDLRFSELFARLADAGTEVLCLPSAFTLATGRDHWEVLVRARAIENQAYVVAANQVGRHTEQWVSYGHSMIVDPWGSVLALAQDDEQIIVADIDLDRVAHIRSRLPALANRRRLSI
jgi:predicted amidohydrolase